MKQLSVFVLVVTLIGALVGCNNEKAPGVPVKYYYPNAAISYGKENGLISYETREGKDKTTEAVIQNYLTGPQSSDYTNPFPSNTVLISYQMQNSTASVVLSDGYASLSGLDLSIANTCLSMTIFELTGAISVTIQCESALLDGNETVELNQYSALLYDSSKTTTPTETTPNTTAK